MSAYAEHTTQFRDAELLIQCLQSLGIDAAGITRHNRAVPLTGYQGDRRSETAEIIISRQYVGMASNDIGFKLGPDGAYRAIISEFDSRHYDGAWMRKLTATYAKAGIMRQAAKAGLRFAGTQTVTINGKQQTKLQFVKA